MHYFTSSVEVLIKWRQLNVKCRDILFDGHLNNTFCQKKRGGGGITSHHVIAPNQIIVTSFKDMRFEKKYGIFKFNLLMIPLWYFKWMIQEKNQLQVQWLKKPVPVLEAIDLFFFCNPFIWIHAYLCVCAVQS